MTPLALPRATGRCSSAWRDADLPRLWDLAELDSAAPLRGPALIALIGEEVWAAVSLSDGRAIADPFRPTAPIVAMLRAWSRAGGAMAA